MGHDFRRLHATDGTWDDFIKDWESQCVEYDEDFSYYLRGPIDVVRDLAEGMLRKDAGAFALHDGYRYCAMCQINSTLLPGYTGKVLRVRMMYLSPHYDLGDTSIDQYVEILSSLFSNIVRLSYSDMQSEHIKFHFRSPVDRQFFGILGYNLDKKAVFRSVEMRGSWLYITK